MVLPWNDSWFETIFDGNKKLSVTWQYLEDHHHGEDHSN